MFTFIQLSFKAFRDTGVGIFLPFWEWGQGSIGLGILSVRSLKLVIL